MRGGFTYIVTNKPFGVLYTGVTADIAARACSLIANAGGSKFAARWDCTRLMLVEVHDTIEEAIAREKMLKNWNRVWKLRLIAEANPNWDDLWDRINV